MPFRKLLSAALILLLLAGCSQPTAQTNTSKYEGYVDEVTVTAPTEADASDAEEETTSPPAEEAIPETVPAPEGKAAEAAPPVENAAMEETPTEEVPVKNASPVADSIAAEAEILAQAPAAVHELLVPVASGTKVHQSDRVVIDYSNKSDGYVMVKFTGSSDKRLRTRVSGPSTDYTYDLKQGQWEVFPLSDGNGSYQVTVFENVVDTKYAAVTSVTFDVRLTDEFAPYLLPNQYVNYSASSKTVAKARELVGSETDTLKKVELVYNYVVTTLSYDTQKAASVKTGYLPVLDTVLEQKKGICFDYAALMAAMLRSQGVPCKLVVGYAGSAYHAWISVWSEETGWVDGAIFFDGSAWQRMDPTFASSGNKSASIMQYIGDGTNYTTKYLY